MTKFFDIQITSGTSPGPFTIWYTVNGTDGIATLVTTLGPATNITSQELIVGVRVFVPDNATRIFVTDNSGVCDDINFKDLPVICPVYFLTVSGLLYFYNPEYNSVVQMYDLTTLGVQFIGFAMTETKLWLLGDGLLHEYDITLSPFTITLHQTYGPNTSLQQCFTITAVNNNFLYGMGTDLYSIIPGVVPAQGMVAVQKIADLNPNPGIIVDDVYYNSNTNSFLTLATDYSDFFNSKSLINQYDMTGNVTGTVNLTSQITPVVKAFLYSHNGNLYYVDKTNNSVYLVNKETSELTFSHNMPPFSGIPDYSAQFDVCSDYSFPPVAPEESQICIECDFGFSSIGARSVYLNVGELISNNGCSIGDYRIDWRNGSEDGEVVFVSYNSGNTDPSLSSITLPKGSHPIVDGIIEGGTLYPIINYVEVNGTKYSSTILSGALYSPDLNNSLCLNTIEVDIIECGTTSILPTYQGLYDYRIVRDIGKGEQSRTFRFSIDDAANYLAWRFNTVDVPDGIKIYYCTDSDPDGILLDYFVAGNNVTENFLPTNYPRQEGYNPSLPVDPIIVSAPNAIEPAIVNYISDFSSYTYQLNDYLKIEIIGNVYDQSKDGTKWTLDLKCFDTLPTPYDTSGFGQKITSTTMSWNDGCYYEVKYNTDDTIYGSPYVNSFYTKYLFNKIYSVGTYNGRLGGSASLSWRTIVQQSGEANFGCVNLNDTMTFTKNSTGITMTFTNSLDYDKAVSDIAHVKNNRYYNNFLSSTPAINSYYSMYRIHGYQSGICETEKKNIFTWYIHLSSENNISYDASGKTISIPFPLTPITNQMVNPEIPCDYRYTYAENAVKALNSTIGVPNGTTYTTGARHYYIIGSTVYGNNQDYHTSIVNPTLYSYFQKIIINNLFNPLNYGYCLVNNQYRAYQVKDKVTLTDTSTHENRLCNWRLERSRYFTTGDCNDLNTYDIIDDYVNCVKII